jgi:hypothetical protein
MKSVLCVLAILCTACLPIYAQSDPTGRWTVEGASIPWEVALNVDGSRLTGAVTSCASVLASFNIDEGTLDGNTITFKCRSGDQQRVISFVGVIAGGEITFTWEKRVKGDPTAHRADDALFGSSAPHQFRVKRIPDNATGTWRVFGVGGPWEVMLRADGHKLSGMVSSCSSNRDVIDISEGKADGASITFMCHNLNHTRTLIFTGRMKGDEIVFTWEKQVQDGGTQRAVDDALFGPSAPQRFTARRVPVANMLPDPNDDFVLGSEFVAAANLPSENVDVEARIIIPRGVTHVRVLLMAIEWGVGFGVFENSPGWPQLARTINGGLLSVRFSGMNWPIGMLNTSEDNRYDALVAVLRRLAEESGHQELKDAPLLFWGHSAAGAVASALAEHMAEKTVGFVRFHSPGQIEGDLSVIRRIPALFFETGPSFDSGRSVGAPWTGVDEGPGVGHADLTKKAAELMITWINAVVGQRVSPDGATLRPLKDDTAWLGNNQTGDVAPSTAYVGSRAEASWLPDEASARGWQKALGKTK